MLATLDLTPTHDPSELDAFVGDSEPMPHGRVFGGQVLAQCVIAASRTVDPDRAVHSMHGYFLRPGDPDQQIVFTVDRIHDGRSFAARRTQAFQEGQPIFSMIASFQRREEGLEHFAPMPEGIPQPEDLPAIEDRISFEHPLTRRLIQDRPVELRHVSAPIYLAPDPQRSASQALWIRVRRPIGDDPTLHAAVLAYMTDISIQEPILRAHGQAWANPRLKLASLDTALWWHRPGRADEWLLYVQESPSASSGRGLATGRLYSQGGDLVASVAQEVVVRIGA
ncbi:MAG TPA: acyl-CoA thioesterase II [Microbacterium sp.]|uniref:acyl-CoA thioesterase n=1 Tax=Microbacterium sp. TaxID=51671 RepID=UPI002C68E009|nr:acyl-CoA thioesterase II [Microbacterium sp.]HWI30378.1 acyl-CoA thioesterase II [Microbacterium sp.]